MLNQERAPHTFQEVIDRVVKMPRDPKLLEALKPHGLHAVNVMWEDTARTQGSVWGPNISDMTLQVIDAADESAGLLPVIRHPNFSDKTADVPVSRVNLPVGNEVLDSSGKPELRPVALTEYLSNLGRYLSRPETLGVDSTSLVTEQDTHVLVSAQACFLPIPQGAGESCSFQPVIFNYQSRIGNPAVLTIMVTPEGTSATVLDNDKDRGSWGQKLFFNAAGEKTCLTGERLTEFRRSEAAEIARSQGISIEEAEKKVEIAGNINQVLIIQVPLKHNADYLADDFNGLDDVELGAGFDWDLEASDSGVAMSSSMDFLELSDVEDAVVSHGESKGIHIEASGYKLERDPAYPIRITVQFYKATSNGVVDQAAIDNITACIKAVYEDGDYVGSLVDGSLQKGALKMGQARPTQPAPSPLAVLQPPRGFLDVVSPFRAGLTPVTGVPE